MDRTTGCGELVIEADSIFCEYIHPFPSPLAQHGKKRKQLIEMGKETLDSYFT